MLIYGTVFFWGALNIDYLCFSVPCHFFWKRCILKVMKHFRGSRNQNFHYPTMMGTFKEFFLIHFVDYNFIICLKVDFFFFFLGTWRKKIRLFFNLNCFIWFDCFELLRWLGCALKLRVIIVIKLFEIHSEINPTESKHKLLICSLPMNRNRTLRSQGCEIILQIIEAVIYRCSSKLMLLKISQYSQENTSVRVSY